MANWLIFVKERFPLPVYALLCGGLSLSGNYLVSERIEWLESGLSFAGLLPFFFVLRLMDELKDYEKDVIANPTRPLPRGVLKPQQVAKAVPVLMGFMLIYSVFVGAIANGVSGLPYAFLPFYLWLMYKEFYTGTWLAERPIFYAITHQVVLIPICLFAVSVVDPKAAFMVPAVFYGIIVLGSFFAYEVCRKLDPKAHPLLKTYLAMYGARGVTILVVISTAIAGVAAVQSGLAVWLLPFEALLLASLTLLFIQPKRFKLIEAAATLSLLFHIWAIAFYHWSINWGLT